MVLNFILYVDVNIITLPYIVFLKQKSPKYMI